MKDPLQYTLESLNILVGRVKLANPDLSDEDILWLASAHIRTMSVCGQDNRIVSKYLISRVKQDAAE